MPVEDIILRVKSVAEIKALGNTYNTLKQLEHAGININKPLKQIDRRMKQLHVSTRNVARVFKPFRMELLSVMFGARMVAGAITQLFQPALEMAGVFELIGMGLAVFFLPAVMALLDPLIALVTWFMDLPEPVKLMIGALLGVIAAFFTFLAAEASLKLFFDGFLRGASTAGTALDGLKVKLLEFSKLAAIGVGIYFLTQTIEDLKTGKYGDAIANAILTGTSFAFAAGKLTVKGAAGLAIGAYFLKSSLEDLKAGNWANAIIEAILSGTMWAWGFGKIGNKFALGIMIMAIGASEFAKDLQNKKWADAIADALIIAGGGAIYKSPFIGGALIAVGVILKFIEPISEFMGKTFKKMETAVIPTIKSKGTAQSGMSYVPQTGLYKLHAGESVSTAGDTFNSSPTINIYGATSGDLVRQISEAVTRDLASLSRR